MTKFTNSKFSVGGVGSKAFEEAYETTFGERRDPKACTICDGRGRVEEKDCEACEGTGRRAYEFQKRSL